MNRALLKQDAKDAMRAANPHPVLVTLVLVAVAFAANFISGLIGGLTGITSALAEDGSSGVSFVSLLIGLVVSVAVSLLLATVQFGYYAYSLKVFKREQTGIGELFAYFPMLLKVFGLSLWMGLFIYLWSLLCVIPGIIAAIRYSQSFFILAENPDMSIRECVNESKRLMSGKIWEYFVLELSFILWLLLVSVTCGIAILYVGPYMQITMAGYYLSLKPAQPVGDSAFDGTAAEG